MAIDKRDLAAAKRLMDKYGDISLSEAIEQEIDKYGDSEAIEHEIGKPGRPRRWDIEEMIEIFSDVATAVASGRKPRQACLAIAAFRGLKLKLVEKRYAEARKALRSLGGASAVEVLALSAFAMARRSPDQLSGRQRRLIEFLRTYKGAAKTTPI
jgi:hypothetical protein